MNIVKSVIIAVALSLVGGLMVLTPASAVDCSTPQECMEQGLQSTGGTGGDTDLASVIKLITNVLMFIIGAVAVIMVIIGGFQYVTSQGDSSKTTTAKNTILYAVIGLIVALLAYAIVQFVVDRFATSSTAQTTTTTNGGSGRGPTPVPEV